MPPAAAGEQRPDPRLRWKHGLDRVAAATLLVLAAPVLAVAALVVKVSSPSGQASVELVAMVPLLVAVALAAPVLAVAALVVKVSSPGPVLARERRIGRDGGSFELLAFRATPSLRRWSLDRLPQLFNVLRGELSFVGPRPERPQFVEIFGENLRRHDQPRLVKPGITGWAQVRGLHGRAPLAERVRWDDWYVENWSLRLDAKIVLMTLRGVCLDDDAS